MGLASIVQKVVATGLGNGTVGHLTPSATLTGVTTGNDLIVCAYGFIPYIQPPVIASVSDTVNSYLTIVTKTGGIYGGVGGETAAIYRAKNVTGGNLTLTVTFTDTTYNGRFSAYGFTFYEVSNLMQAPNYDVINSGSGIGTSGTNAPVPVSAGSIAPNQNGDIYFVAASSAIATVASSSQLSASGSFTLDQSSTNSTGGNDSTIGSMSQINAGQSALVCSFTTPATGTSYGWAAAAAAFQNSNPTTGVISFSGKYLLTI